MKIKTTEATRKMLSECKDSICIELNGDDLISLLQHKVVGESYQSDIVIVYKRANNET